MERKLSICCAAGSADFDTREHFYYSYATYLYLEALRCRVGADYNQSPAQEQMIEGHVDMLLSVLNRLGMSRIIFDASFAYINNATKSSRNSLPLSVG